jgi:pimeloyl-ACP methyl ester carboxylesterase
VRLDPTATPQAPFVLVHGAWHGAWTWCRLAPLLRAAGHEVWTPTLTGLGDRAHLRSPAINLSLHVRDVVMAIEAEDLTDVVLVGHSYAGIVVGMVAALIPERIGRLVYMDSFLAKPGRSLFDLVSAPERDHLRMVAARSDEPWLLPPFPPAGYGVTAPRDAEWLARKLDPMPIACFEEPARFDPRALEAVPASYIFATASERDRFSGFAAEFRGREDRGYHEVASGHDMMLTHVDAVAAILEIERRAVGGCAGAMSDGGE